MPQISFPESDAASRDRLFYAILPDGAAAAEIAETGRWLRARHGLNGRVLESRHFHIALHHLGDYAGLPKGIVAAALDAGAAVAAQPFGIAFGRAMSFSRGNDKNPFVLLGGDGVIALRAFQQLLGEAMMRFGLRRHVERQFNPHLVLLYDGQTVGEQTISPIAWAAHEFVLIHCVLGETTHTTLGRWPLRG
jgi:2'-5' RNA ligase